MAGSERRIKDAAKKHDKKAVMLKPCFAARAP